MDIDYRALRSVTAREFIAALTRDGFYFVRQVGSHERYRHPDGRRVTVAPHGSGGTFKRRTLKSIFEGFVPLGEPGNDVSCPLVRGTWGRGRADRQLQPQRRH